MDKKWKPFVAGVAISGVGLLAASLSGWALSSTYPLGKLPGNALAMAFGCLMGAFLFIYGLYIAVAILIRNARSSAR